MELKEYCSTEVILLRPAASPALLEAFSPLRVNADEHVPPFSDGRFPPEAGEVGVWAQNGIA